MSKHIRPGIGKTLLLERYVWWQLKAGLAFHFGRSINMCGRYRRTTQEEELARLYHIPIPKQTDLPISYNIAPSCGELNQDRKREFRPRGSIAYDLRILSWKQDKSLVNLWTLDGRQKVPFACGDHHRDLMAFPQGESDLVYRAGEWFLFT